MASLRSSLLFNLTFLVLLLLASIVCGVANEERKVYVVYMGSLPREQLYSPTSHHVSLLQKVVGQRYAPDLKVRSYSKSFNGFAANLTRNEAEELFGMVQDVVSVFPARKLNLLTTRSWDFLGLKEATKRSLKTESDIVIGIMDTGVWPELASFSDEGFGPPPRKWKGACRGGSNFTCNNKLVGARYYHHTNGSARDGYGHGSHTASTAAGVTVKDISFYGLAQGTARGGVPSARIAAYKVSDDYGNIDDANVLAAFDDAIADGVDIISASFRGKDFLEIEHDSVAIGAFHAMEKGILTSQAAGNFGNIYGLIVSHAPWLITVAASTMDRRVVTEAVLGNGKTLVGMSFSPRSLNGTMFPIVYASGLSMINGSFKGKILVVQSIIDVSTAESHGAVGAMYKAEFEDVSLYVAIPAVGLSEAGYNEVLSYLNSSKAPVGSILRSETIKDFSAPRVASFSSWGPNPSFHEIMKPDIAAPGVNVLAGYSPLATISDGFPLDKRRVKYNIASGTSMACPHISGIAAYVKSFHPGWSPAAIKSAIMTTASPMNAPRGEFAHGSGHVDPVKAIHPGLVYETRKEDYIRLLCRVGFGGSKLRLIAGENISCPGDGEKNTVMDFNYPALTAKVKENMPFTLSFHRTVTNVGHANSTYKLNVSPARKFIVEVEPDILRFKSLEEKKSFNVTLYGCGKGIAANSSESSSLVWFDGVHSVRIPITVHTIPPPQFPSSMTP